MRYTDDDEQGQYAYSEEDELAELNQESDVPKKQRQVRRSQQQRSQKNSRRHSEKRKSRGAGRFFKCAAIILPIIVIAGIVFVTMFPVKELTIEGSSHVTEDMVKTAINWDKYKQNSIIVFFMGKKADLSNAPLIDNLQVTLKGPNSVNVLVTEKTIVGCIQAGDAYFYFDEKGMIVMTNDEKEASVPLVSGLTAEEIAVGSYLKTEDEDIFSAILEIARLLSRYGIAIDDILVDDDTFSLNMGSVTVNLGTDINMEEKISEFNDLKSELDGLSGILHLENYDSTKDSIIFEKDKK